jgi:hypothetical protein
LVLFSGFRISSVVFANNKLQSKIHAILGMPASTMTTSIPILMILTLTQQSMKLHNREVDHWGKERGGKS